VTSTLDESALDAQLVAVLGSPEGRADPYPGYAVLREATPVFRSSLGSWVVTRFEECHQVLRRPQFAKSTGTDEMARLRRQRWNIPPAEAAEVAAFLEGRRSMLSLNPPDHTRLRGLVARAFTPTTVEALRPRVEALCDDLLDELADHAAGGAAVDVMAVLAFPFPVSVIGELLGVPRADRPQFQDLVRVATAVLEPLSTLEDLRASVAARRTMEGYFTALVAERRHDPGDDLLSELVAVSDGSDRLSEEEVVTTAILLFAAGFETTTNLIGNGLLALLHHPRELDRLRAGAGDPGTVARAVEELLRFDSPVQLDTRVTTAAVDLAGRRIPAGDTVMTLLGSANRDPRHFSRPERFDIGRDEGPPMSFGSGIHHCLGAALARVEAQVCFGRLLRRFAAAEPGGPVVRRDTVTLRGPLRLPLLLRAA